MLNKNSLLKTVFSLLLSAPLIFGAVTLTAPEASASAGITCGYACPEGQWYWTTASDCGHCFWIAKANCPSPSIDFYCE